MKGSEDIITPGCIICLLQVEEDSNKVLTDARERHSVCGILGPPGGPGGSMTSKSALCTGDEVSAFQDPGKTTVHHALHCLAQVTSEAIGL